MQLKEIYLKNFRGIKNLHLKLERPTTILIGENNTGKTTILEAVKIVLNRARITKNNLFSEFDFYSEDQEGGLDNEILIELWFKEDTENEWDAEIVVELDGIVQPDILRNNLNALGIRLRGIYNQEEKTSNAKWFWLGLDRSEVQEINTSHTIFFNIVQFFYLNALRDADFSFSGRSQFWNQFLRLDMTTADEVSFTAQLQTINENILSSDTKIDQLKNKLDAIPQVISNDIENISIQAFSEKPWDLSDKAKLMITTKGSQIELPLERFGQGTQSLAVLMLFKAYDEILMQRNTHEHAFSILGLEEPEVHLHPQAVRSLWTFLEKIDQQKIISTHSTFFIQDADLTSLRLLKRKGNTIELFYIKRSFEVELPQNAELASFHSTNTNASFVSYPSTDGTPTNGIFTINGKLSDEDFRALNTIYIGNPAALVAITGLQKASSIYLSDDDLLDLKFYTERVRGEIFFAKGWLLCEGQTEYMLLRCFAHLMEKDLDQHGISVIDYKNDGSAGKFIVLAKNFDMPWLLLSDSDQAYTNTIKEIKGRKISQAEIDAQVTTYGTPNTDIEAFLYDNGFKEDYLSILSEGLDFSNGATSLTIGQKNKETRAALYFKSDNTLNIKITVSDSHEVEIMETGRQFQQLYAKILKKKNISEHDITRQKTSADFSTQTEALLQTAKVATINHELSKENGTYKINLSVHGNTKRVDDTHPDYTKLLRYCTIQLIKKKKILNARKLIRNLRKENATEARVPSFYKDLINKLIGML